MALTKWNPSDKSSNVALSNTDHTATSGGPSGNEGVRGTTSHSSGKWYVEYTNIQTGGNGYGVGFGPSSESLTTNNRPEFRLASGGGVNTPNGSGYVGPAVDPTGHTVGFALDLDSATKRGWVQFDGTWYGNAGALGSPPAPGDTSGYDLASANFPWFPSLWLQFSAHTCDINCGDLTFVHNPPSGFLAWQNDSPSGIWASNEAQDVFAAVGYPGYPGVVGSLAATEAKDTFAAVGVVPTIGTWQSVETPDHFSAYGGQPLSGAWASVEAPDHFAGTGIGIGEDGILSAVEASDVFAAIGTTPISGSFNGLEAPDRFQAFGAGVTQVRRRRSFFVT